MKKMTSFAMQKFGEHIKTVGEKIDEESVKEMIETIQESNKVFVVGAGRSGLVSKMFAMRLMHLGLNVFVVGETITPALDPTDAVVAISGSGETSSTVEIAKTTVENNASLVSITGSPNSSLGDLSDIIISISDEFNGDINQEEIAPLGTLFELTSAVLLDSIVSEMMDIMDKDEVDLKEKHATLE